VKLVSITNPELRRNLWLELTLHRLLAAPLVIALCAALILAASEKDSLEIPRCCCGERSSPAPA
jgi:hypothetical protein